MEDLKTQVKVLEDVVQAAIDKAVEKLHNLLRPVQDDTETLNK